MLGSAMEGEGAGADAGADDAGGAWAGAAACGGSGMVGAGHGIGPQPDAGCACVWAAADGALCLAVDGPFLPYDCCCVLKSCGAGVNGWVAAAVVRCMISATILDQPRNGSELLLRLSNAPKVML